MAHLHLGMNIRETTKTASMLSAVYGQTQARYRVSKSLGLGLAQRFLDVLALRTSAFNPNDDLSELICHYYSGEG